MVGIHEILNKIMHHTPLALEQKIHSLYYKNMDSKVLTYLKSILKNLYIEITGEYEGTIFELMLDGMLEGWCWQTTESAIIFFADEDYIERGLLQFGYDYPDYYHSWICFNFEGKQYIFDPCLAILCTKEDYYRTFSVTLKGQVLAHDVKEELWKRIHTPSQEASMPLERKYSSKFWPRYFDDDHSKEGEVVMNGPEDVNTPFYRNNVGYKVKENDGKIKKIVAHYYYNG